MHRSELTAVEQRVLGCLIEKRWTTPDQYPLSINALRLACNQSTNRDPVTDYDESQVRAAADRLTRYGLARLASGAGSRATKYRHLAEEALGLEREQLAVLCVMLLRGPQTPGELKGRSERMAHLATLADVERVLDDLTSRGYCERMARRPGQKEDRYRHLLGEGALDGDSEHATVPETASADPRALPVQEARVAADWDAPTATASGTPMVLGRDAPTATASGTPMVLGRDAPTATAPGTPMVLGRDAPTATAPGAHGAAVASGDGALAERVSALEAEIDELRSLRAQLEELQRLRAEIGELRSLQADVAALRQQLAELFE